MGLGWRMRAGDRDEDFTQIIRTQNKAILKRKPLDSRKVIFQLNLNDPSKGLQTKKGAPPTS